MEDAERGARMKSLAAEPDPSRKRLLALGVLTDRLRAWVQWTSEEDRRWSRRLALLYSDRLDWEHLRCRTGENPVEAQALWELEREAKQ